MNTCPKKFYITNFFGYPTIVKNTNNSLAKSGEVVWSKTNRLEKGHLIYLDTLDLKEISKSETIVYILG